MAPAKPKSPSKAKQRPAAPAPTPVPAATQAPANASLAAASAAAAAMTAEELEEAHIPRWRRQSVREARAASERAPSAPAVKMKFQTDPEAGVERFQVRYALVTITDTMDEVTGARVGELQAGDEVEVLDRQAAWVMVRTPYGVEGWIHRTTLGSRIQPKTAEAGGATDSSTGNGSSGDEAPQLEDLLANITAQRQAPANVEASGQAAVEAAASGEMAEAVDQEPGPEPVKTLPPAPKSQGSRQSRSRRHSRPASAS